MKNSLNEILRKCIGENLYILLTSKLSYYRFLSKYYTRNNEIKNVKPYVIYMADGRVIHGGLVDRLRAMVTLYVFSKKKGIDFKIHFSSPFSLSDYLEPNLYNWQINDNNISYNSCVSKAIVVKSNRIDEDKNLENRLGKDIGTVQLHVYTNAFSKSIDFKKEFAELFKPSDALNEAIAVNLSRLSNDYVSITFRFQQLLGDFKEGNYRILDDSDKTKLIGRCDHFVNEVRQKHSTINKILITSDSSSYLKHVKEKYDFVYIIPGEVLHVDYTDNDSDLAYMKSFVDLFMLSRAKKLYNFSTGAMYRDSGFAAFAATIGGKPYERVIR